MTDFINSLAHEVLDGNFEFVILHHIIMLDIVCVASHIALKI